MQSNIEKEEVEAVEVKMNVFQRIRNFYKEPQAIEQIACQETVNKSYKHWRIRIFYSCFIYVIFDLYIINLIIKRK